MLPKHPESSHSHFVPVTTYKFFLTPLIKKNNFIVLHFFPMDSTSKFRFRDQGMGYSTQTDSSSDQFSSPTDSDEPDFNVESMTCKGIERLCSELLDLKKASCDDLHKSVYENYSVFLRIIEEVKGLENEISNIGRQISTQRTLVEDLIDSTDYESISDEIAEPNVENLFATPLINDEETLYNSLFSEAFEVLLLENKPDEALDILEQELESMISEKADLDQTLDQTSLLKLQNKLIEHYVMAAEQSRINNSEFQDALTGLYRLGETQRAQSLLIQHYRSRLTEIMTGLKNLKQFGDGIYAKELANAVYTTISQAAGSFAKLEGETFTISSKFYEWTQNATEEFVVSFDAYIKSIAEPSLGLVVAADAVHHLWHLCTLLEAQGLVLKPYLTKHIQPCLEDLFHSCIDHFKRSISTFVTNDNWVLGEFLVSSSLSALVNVATKKTQEFFLLTSSGWMVIQQMQTMLGDVSSVLFLPMESITLEGFADLFMEYVATLENCITVERNVNEEDATTFNLATEMPQQLSILINMSTLVSHLLPCIAKQTLDHAGLSEAIHKKEFNRYSHRKMLENWISTIENAERRLRHLFCLELVETIMLPKQSGTEIKEENYFDSVSQSAKSNHSMPSMNVQVLFLRLGQLKNLGAELSIGLCWNVEELLMDVTKAVIEWISEHYEQFNLLSTDSSAYHSRNILQVMRDIQFLFETARYGGYASESIVDASSDLIDEMETAFLEAGGDLSILTAEDENWASEAALAAIAKLQEWEESKALLQREPASVAQNTYNREVAEEGVKDGTLDVEVNNSWDGNDEYDVEEQMTDISAVKIEPQRGSPIDQRTANSNN